MFFAAEQPLSQPPCNLDLSLTLRAHTLSARHSLRSRSGRPISLLAAVSSTFLQPRCPPHALPRERESFLSIPLSPHLPSLDRSRGLFSRYSSNGATRTPRQGGDSEIEIVAARFIPGAVNGPRASALGFVFFLRRCCSRLRRVVCCSSLPEQGMTPFFRAHGEIQSL